ncbi:MAG: DnaJ domain-containing protein [Brevinematia bacterium]
MKNYYDILGVSQDADLKTIKKAFRELAKKFHPDSKKNLRNQSKVFEEITAAYSVLSNPKKRKLYDESLKTLKKPNFFEFFNFKELKKIIIPAFEKISFKNLVTDTKNQRLSEEELINNILYSKNLYVQKYSVRMLINKNKLYPLSDLLRLLYANINEEVKITIIEELGKKRLSKKVKEVLKEIHKIETSQKVKNAIVSLNV